VILLKILVHTTKKLGFGKSIIKKAERFYHHSFSILSAFFSSPSATSSTSIAFFPSRAS